LLDCVHTLPLFEMPFTAPVAGHFARLSPSRRLPPAQRMQIAARRRIFSAHCFWSRVRTAVMTCSGRAGSGGCASVPWASSLSERGWSPTSVIILAPGKAARTAVSPVCRACYAVLARPVASVGSVQWRYSTAARPFGESWARLGPG
jgi:hypothetical protein